MAKKPKKSYRKYNPDADKLAYDFSYNDYETTELHEGINRNPDIDINDLRRIALWKINRVLDVSEDTISKLQNLARLKIPTIDDPLVREILGDLVESQGIGFPMASAILKFINPEVFPIIDVRAYRALTGTKPSYASYTCEKYVQYTKDLKKEADRIGLSLRKMDEQLYCFDKQYNGKI